MEKKKTLIETFYSVTIATKDIVIIGQNGGQNITAGYFNG
jgi:hypothetical protein